MGSSILIVPTIASIELLGVAIAELGLVLKEMKELQDESRQLHRVEYSFQNEKGEIIGVRRTKEGQVEFVLAHPHSEETKKTLNRVKQSYARLKVLDEVKRKGYRNVKEEKLPNGSIRLVVEKWQ